jgi:Mitochondrial carrier protein
MADAYGSACAGIISRIFTHPLDTAKAKLQVPILVQQQQQPTSTKFYSTNNSNNNALRVNLPHQSQHTNTTSFQYYSNDRGPIDVIRRTIRTEGIRGLYRGFDIIVVGGTPGTVCYLCTYEYTKNTLSQLVGTMRSSSSSTIAMKDDSLLRRQQQQKQSHSSSFDFMIHFMSGMIAETVACIIYVPVDVIKVSTFSFLLVVCV